ncbi:MAG: zinc ribbon domain-containing protein [Erysipelotrichaceae bacterium]|nr:zinc ribbon domain-containing protein [Erysipelotrichaceae bacterium]
MKCPNCGKEIADGSKFCGFCGYQLSEEEIKQGSSNGAKNVLNNITNVIKNTDKKILGIAALVVCLVIGVVVFFTTRKPTINLKDYVTVEISGADGYGRANVDFDYDQFEIDVLDAAGLSDVYYTYYNYDYDDLQYVLSSEEYTKLYNLVYAYESVDYDVDVTSGLSNGDVVTVTFTYNNDLAANAGFKFKGSDIKTTVSDLGELEAIDPFEGVTIDYQGVSPYLTATVNTDGANDVVSNYVGFSLSQSREITLGDTITLSITNYDEEDFANDYGVTFTTLSKDYVCEDASYYTKAASEITDTFLSDAKAIVEESLSDGLNLNTSSTNTKAYVSTENVTYVGYYFLYLDDFADYSTYRDREYNFLYLVYSATVKSSDDSFDDMDVYFLVGPSNITTNQSTGEISATLEAGNLMESDSLWIFGYTLQSGDKYKVLAFESLSDAKEAVNSNYGDYYTIESVDLD